MRPTQTGIAVALALSVVAIFFIFPGFVPFLAGLFSSHNASDLTANENQPTAMPLNSEEGDKLQMTDTVSGSGATVEPGDTITVHYVGTLTNGSVFDASRNHGEQGFTFTVGAGQVIQGWDQGLIGMKEGGKRKLVIPAALGYGNQAIGNIIPANSTLVFEVELLSVQKGQ